MRYNPSFEQQEAILRLNGSYERCTFIPKKSKSKTSQLPHTIHPRNNDRAAIEEAYNSRGRSARVQPVIISIKKAIAPIETAKMHPKITG